MLLQWKDHSSLQHAQNFGLIQRSIRKLFTKKFVQEHWGCLITHSLNLHVREIRKVNTHWAPLSWSYGISCIPFLQPSKHLFLFLSYPCLLTVEFLHLGSPALSLLTPYALRVCRTLLLTLSPATQYSSMNAWRCTCTLSKSTVEFACLVVTI